MAAVDWVQQRMGAGDQSNESAAEQAKDEMISDSIRKQVSTAVLSLSSCTAHSRPMISLSQYESMTGKPFPVK